jgi:hypothetical protein
MKFILIFLILINSVFSVDLKEGDILFQETGGEQGKAIKLATKSRYTHVGVVFDYKGELLVLEAVGPVKKTKLKDFINRGINKHYVIKRLKNAEDKLTNDNIVKLKEAGDKYLGLPYDIYFGWQNDRIYCTELVWKIYKEILGIELGRLGKLKDFDLSSFTVRLLMFKRYGLKIPYDEPVIAPSTMFDSKELETVDTIN